MEIIGELKVPAALSWEKDSILIKYENGLAPELVFAVLEKIQFLVPLGIRTPDCQVLSSNPVFCGVRIHHLCIHYMRFMPSKAVPWLGQLVAVISPRIAGFDPR